MIIASSPEELIADITKFVQHIGRAVVQTVAQEVHDNTPKDTGYAQSNWTVTIGSPATGVFGSKQAVDSGGFRSSLATINGWSLREPAYITNNVPYIGRLNDGWSSQAPAGFIEAAMAAGINLSLAGI